MLANRMAQLDFSLKDKSSTKSRNFTNISLFKYEPLPEDFKLPNFTKFNDTRDPKVHLRQYAIFMAPIKLIESQVVKFFFISLDEGLRA